VEHEAGIRLQLIKEFGPRRSGAPNCLRTTIYEASERDFNIVFLHDATRASTPGDLTNCEGSGSSFKTRTSACPRSERPGWSVGQPSPSIRARPSEEGMA
jgi:hypothetical protein